jgi:UDP-4-amino-4-deoxy-L-arabinose formyltransferase/UDP-glucuronic acid dehydrogenase (UDP-4-keto-hexauronic acid decarboxylating)
MTGVRAKGRRAVVMGYHGMGCLGLEALLRHDYEVAAVLTHRDDPHEQVWWPSLAELASCRGIPVHFPATMKDPAAFEVVSSLAPDFIFSFYFRFMIPETVLACARRGALNLHGSLLPRYRGRAPVNWVLVNGETETGVSLHYMVAKPDAGPLVDQERVAIAFEDTAFTLFGKLEAAAGRLLDRALPALRDGTAVARALDLSLGSYFGGRRPEDGRIDWSWPADRIYNLVRAVTHPYPGAFTEVDGSRLYVWWGLPERETAGAPPGTIAAVERDGLWVSAGQGALRLVTLQLEGQPELPAPALARSRGWLPGRRLGE